MTRNKKLIIISIIAIAILLIIGLIVFQNKGNVLREKENQNINGQNRPAPEFLSTEEKIERGIAPEQKIQILERGKNEVYKVIKDDSDIVSDPAAVGPISPRQASPIK